MTGKCRLCGSYAINPDMHDRNPKVDTDLCDVCYWKTRFEKLAKTTKDLLAYSGRKVGDKTLISLRDKIIEMNRKFEK